MTYGHLCTPGTGARTRGALLLLPKVRPGLSGAWVFSMVCAAALVGTLGVPDPVAGQKGRREVEAGNRLYEEGRYQEAHARYLSAMEKVPGLPLARFNEGNALYQSQEFQRALEAYTEALEAGDPGWEAGAWYNLGNALVRQQQLGAAVEAYKEALRRNPTDQDAKHNLEVALRQQQEQQQQEQQQPQDGKGEGDANPEGDPDERKDGQGENEAQPPAEGEDTGGDEPSRAGDNPDPRSDEGNQRESPENREEGSSAAEAPVRMTPEQAERLLRAITEDPGEVSRKTPTARGRRPKKDW